jgi:hypothetical protein
MASIEETKELLSEHRSRIKLYDHILEQVGAAVSATSEEIFPVTGNWSVEAFIDRLHRYEATSHQLVQTAALLAFWGEPFHEQMLTVAPRRLAGQFTAQSGLSAWLALRWYPISLLSYSAGIAAVFARRYTNLRQVLLLSIEDPESRSRWPLVTTLTRRISDVEHAFKMMPGYDRFFTPRSEYVYKLMHPILDAALSLGSEYEVCFDEFASELASNWTLLVPTGAIRVEV